MGPKFINRKKYAKKLGVSDRTITNWMHVGANGEPGWINGRHYVVVGRQTLINVPEVDKWLISRQECKHTEKA